MEFLEVRVFTPNAKPYANIELSKPYEINEKHKKKTCNERIQKNEKMSHECRKFYSHVPGMICKKRETNYNVSVTWI